MPLSWEPLKCWYSRWDCVAILYGSKFLHTSVIIWLPARINNFRLGRAVLAVVPLNHKFIRDRGFCWTSGFRVLVYFCKSYHLQVLYRDNKQHVTWPWHKSAPRLAISLTCKTVKSCFSTKFSDEKTNVPVSSHGNVERLSLVSDCKP